MDGKKEYSPGNPSKTVEIHAFSAWQEKIQTQKSYGYWKSLKNLGKHNVCGRLECKCQEAERCAPLRRAQESQCHTMEIIGKP